MAKMVHIFFVCMMVAALSVPLFAQSSFLDPTFGMDGRALANIAGGDSDGDVGSAMAIQIDGKIVVAGSSSGGSSYSAFAVARFNPDGSLDDAFGIGGTARAYIAGSDSADDKGYAVAIQPDGKIVVAGESEDTSNNETFRRFALARFNSNGTLDNTFGTGGTVRGSVTGGGNTDVGRAIALLPDGKIIVAGYSIQNNSFGLGPPVLAVARFNSNGSIDRTFGSDGSIQVPQFVTSSRCSIAVQPDGKIVCAGTALVNQNAVPVAFSVARLDSNGTIDNTFGSSGMAYTFIAGGDSTVDMGYSVALETDGKIVVAGLSGGTIPSPTGNTSIAVVRFNPDGTPDKTFGTNGTVSFSPTGPDSTYAAAHSVAIQSDGKIIVAGQAGYFTPVSFAVVRFDSDGTVDRTFGSGGIALADSFTAEDVEDVANAVAIQSDGKIVAAGNSSGYIVGGAFAVARFLPSNATAITKVNPVPMSFALYQNYPNPFNPTTEIRYQISEVIRVSLKVYDILGREVTTLVNEKQNPGSYSVTFDGSRLASGIYFYRLVAGSYSATKKLVFMK